MKIAIAIALLAASSAFATDLVVGSAGYQTDQWNANGANIEASRSLNWTTPYPGTAWVSWGQTGNSNDPNYIDVSVGTTVVFTHMFYLSGTPTGGLLKALSADTAEIKLNGIVIKSMDSTFGSDYYGCGDMFGCRFNTEANVTVTAAQLKSGLNKLEITVKKGMVTALNGQKTGFGVDYILTASYTPAGCSQ